MTGKKLSMTGKGKLCWKPRAIH